MINFRLAGDCNWQGKAKERAEEPASCSSSKINSRMKYNFRKASVFKMKHFLFPFIFQGHEKCALLILGETQDLGLINATNSALQMWVFAQLVEIRNFPSFSHYFRQSFSTKRYWKFTEMRKEKYLVTWQRVLPPILGSRQYIRNRQKRCEPSSGKGPRKNQTLAMDAPRLKMSSSWAPGIAIIRDKNVGGIVLVPIHVFLELLSWMGYKLGVPKLWLKGHIWPTNIFLAGSLSPVSI